MLDYYSSLPPPSIISEKVCIKRVYKEKNKHKKLKIDKLVNDYEQNCILDELLIPHLNEQGNIKYSYTGWFAGAHRREVEYYFNIKIDKLRKKKIILKIRVIFKIVYLLHKWHKETKEKMYHPDSEYVKNILQANFYERMNS